MDITVEAKIYQTLLENEEEMTALELSELPGVGGRTYVSRLLRKLVEEKKVYSRKDGRNVFYRAVAGVAIDESFSTRNLNEEMIWEKAYENEKFFKPVSEQARDILAFSSLEMINNAIDHSKSGSVHVKIWREMGFLKFTVRDFGVGIFNNIMAKNGFSDEYEAVQWLLKGKNTTDKTRHSGEGIFWTSKIADKMIISSGKFKLTFENIIDKCAIEDVDESVLGTEIYFELQEDSEKSMSELFHQYSFDDEKLTLDVTRIPVGLYGSGDVWISRSQARRVLDGLDKFKKVTFDFSGVKLIGQGFADEIFRVYQIKHPDMVFEYENANETIQLLIERAKNDKTGR